MGRQKEGQGSGEERGDDARRGPQPPFAALNLSKVRPESRHFHVFHIARVGSVSLLHTGIRKPSLRAIGRLSCSLTDGEVPRVSHCTRPPKQPPVRLPDFPQAVAMSADSLLTGRWRTRRTTAPWQYASAVTVWNTF